MFYVNVLRPRNTGAVCLPYLSIIPRSFQINASSDVFPFSLFMYRYKYIFIFLTFISVRSNVIYIYIHRSRQVD